MRLPRTIESILIEVQRQLVPPPAHETARRIASEACRLQREADTERAATVGWWNVERQPLVVTKPDAARHPAV